MSDWQSQGYDPARQRPAAPPQWGQPQYPAPQQPQYQPERYEPRQQPRPAAHVFQKTSLTAAEMFWYVLMCIAFGGGYFAKIPTAKAISELPQFRAAARPELEYRR